MNHFLYYISKSHLLFKSDQFVVEISPDITSENVLFSEYKNKLLLPDYFNFNWDSFDECLRDLNWIAQKKIVILHINLPKIGKTCLSIYLNILNRAIFDWQNDDLHTVDVFFQEQDRSVIDSIFDNHHLS